MGFWSSIKDAFSGKDDATRIQELAAELSRYADRYENAGDAENAALARDYAERVASARSLKEAKALYSEFKAVTSKYHDEGCHERQHHAIDDGREDTWSDNS